MPVAAAADPAPLVVGSIRDTDGLPVVGGTVRAYDAAGAPVGSGQDRRRRHVRRDRLGAARVPVVVACTYCAAKRVRFPGAAPAPLVVIVMRYRALFGAALDQQRLRRAPVRAPGPGDRPRALRRAAPARSRRLRRRHLRPRARARLRPRRRRRRACLRPDPRRFRPCRFPGRERTGGADRTRDHAYRYGSYAGGGTFILTTRDPQTRQRRPNRARRVVLQLRSHRRFAPVAAISQGDGNRQPACRRDYEGDFLGGVLRLGASMSDERAFDEAVVPSSFSDIAYASYATASRRYRTFIDASASETGFDDQATATPQNGDSTQLIGSFRLEHPGPLRPRSASSRSNTPGTYSIAYANTVNARDTDDSSICRRRAATAGSSLTRARASRRSASTSTRRAASEAASTTTFLPSLAIASRSAAASTSRRRVAIAAHPDPARTLGRVATALRPTARVGT